MLRLATVGDIAAPTAVADAAGAAAGTDAAAAAAAREVRWALPGSSIGRRRARKL